MDIGQYNKLMVTRFVDFGLYLADEQGNEVLLPACYITENPVVGDEMEVFVYTDSEDRPVATTEHPLAIVGQVAFLRVADVSRIGAFMDWGLSKDLLCPFREQQATMKRGGVYPVYVYLDNASGRVVASAKLGKFLGNTIPRYRRGDKVEALVLRHTEFGYRVVVDNLFMGMIYDTQLYAPLAVGRTVVAYVSKVRDDGKIDLTVSGSSRDDIERLADRIADYITHQSGGHKVDDTMSPDDIKAIFGCSKRVFKQALGHLYKTSRLLKT